MPIQNFPISLQPIIQQGMLEREFQDALRSRLGYRMAADRMDFSIGIGETLTKTRTGLKRSVTTPLNATTNTNLDNGLTPSTVGVEQYTITLNHYADTIDLNMVTSRAGIASQFLLNTKVNGEQAARSLDEIARNALFNSYFGGNTRVRTTLGSAGVAFAVDDVRGFQFAPYAAGFTSAAAALAAGATPTWAAVSTANTLSVTVGSNVYTLTGVAVDGTNLSTAPNGISGVLTFSTNVSVADGTAANAVTAANASSIIRPNSRATTAAVTSADTLTMSALLNAVAQLRVNAVPEIDGAFNCYLDPISARQLFADNDFRQLFQGATSANQIFKSGMVNDFLGLRFMPTTEAYVQTLSGVTVRRPIVVGQGALIEGDFAGMGAADVAPDESLISIVDGVAMVVREPIDRLQQIIAQSWYWIGGFCAPSDITTNPNTVPTATNAAFKRAVMIEHAG